MMTKASLQKLKDILPRGSVKIIAEKSDVSLSTVRKVLSGERRNQKVLEEAIMLAKETQEKESSLNNEIQNL